MSTPDGLRQGQGRWYYITCNVTVKGRFTGTLSIEITASQQQSKWHGNRKVYIVKVFRAYYLREGVEEIQAVVLHKTAHTRKLMLSSKIINICYTLVFHFFP